MRRPLWLAVALTLAACHGKAPPAEPPPPPAAPFAFVQKTAAGEVSLTIPRRIGGYPALHKALYDSGRRQLTEFLDQAAIERAHTETRPGPVSPYVRTSVWRVAGDTPRLLSLAEAWYLYQGGAHPNHGTNTKLWDKAAEAEIDQAALFADTADLTRLDAVLCEAIRRAKVARLGAPALKGEFWTCPQWRSARAVLAPSTIPGHAGGLTFLLDPYVVGPYAEGDYAVTVPQAAFHAALAPAYADQFQGDPVP